MCAWTVPSQYVKCVCVRCVYRSVGGVCGRCAACLIVPSQYLKCVCVGGEPPMQSVCEVCEVCAYSVRCVKEVCERFLCGVCVHVQVDA